MAFSLADKLEKLSGIDIILIGLAWFSLFVLVYTIRDTVEDFLDALFHLDWYWYALFFALAVMHPLTALLRKRREN